jgi:hypothetical protein
MTEHKTAAELARDTLIHLEEKYGAPVNALRARLDELEQKAARPVFFGGESQGESWGEQFANADGLKSFAEDHSRPGRFRMEVKSTMTTGTTSGGPVGAAPYRDGINDADAPASSPQPAAHRADQHGRCGVPQADHAHEQREHRA